MINGESASDISGFSVSSAGDVNGDGLADLLVGAYMYSAGTGRSYVVYGTTSTAAINLSVIAAGTGGFVINGQTGGELSGYSVSSAGDVNGDGLSDLIIGAHWADTAAGVDAGRSYLVFGQTGTAAVDLSVIANGTGGFVINGQGAGDFSGTSVSNAGDVDGDGLSDLIIGARSSDPAGAAEAGRSYVILSSQIMGGNFGAQLTQLGGSSNDTLTGTAGVDRMAGGQGADTLIGSGGADVMYGGAGNDTFVLNSSNITSIAGMRIDGGSGFDTVKLDASVLNTQTLDLSTLSNIAIQGVESIDLSGNGVNNTLRLNTSDLLSIHDESGQAGGATTINRLLVKGDVGDAVQLVGSWSSAGAENIDLVAYNVYVNSANLVDKLLVQQGVTVV